MIQNNWFGIESIFEEIELTLDGSEVIIESINYLQPPTPNKAILGVLDSGQLLKIITVSVYAMPAG